MIVLIFRAVLNSECPFIFHCYLIWTVTAHFWVIKYIIVDPLLSWSKTPWGYLFFFLGLKAPRMCLTLVTSEYFLCWAQRRNSSEVYDSRPCDSEPERTVQGSSGSSNSSSSWPRSVQKDGGWQMVHLHHSLCPSQHLSLGYRCSTASPTSRHPCSLGSERSVFAVIDYAVTFNSCVNSGACLGLNTSLVCRYKAGILNQSLQRGWG